MGIRSGVLKYPRLSTYPYGEGGRRRGGERNNGIRHSPRHCNSPGNRPNRQKKPCAFSRREDPLHGPEG